MKKISQTKAKRTPKIKVEMSGEGLTIYGGLLPVFNFMKMLGLRKTLSRKLSVVRGVNAKYQIADAVEMTVVGLIATQWSK